MNENDRFLFSPPLVFQRYSKVLEILNKERPQKSAQQQTSEQNIFFWLLSNHLKPLQTVLPLTALQVIDFGCSECRLIQLLKSEDYIEEICGVDVDKAILEHSKWKIEPLTSDYITPRSRPLIVRLIHGSVLVLDDAFKHFDAVTCIELIEHLLPKQLPSLEKNIFGFIQPNLVIISTPNSDFNVVFGNSIEFRHWDHKFEWSREEFIGWCTKICDQYSYTFELDGVGVAPKAKDVGFCSQFAIFRRIARVETDINGLKNKNLYENQVAESVHPFKTAIERQEELLFSKFLSCANSLLDICKTISSKLKNGKELSVRTTELEKSLSLIKLNGFHNSRRSSFTKINIAANELHQFSDAEDDSVTKDFMTLNTYGQERSSAIIKPLDHEYSQYLLNLCSYARKGYVQHGQFDDCDNQTSGDGKMMEKEILLSLSQYNSTFSSLVRITNISISEDQDESIPVVLYRLSNCLRLSFKFLYGCDELKGLEAETKLQSLLKTKQLEGIEISEDENYLLVDLDISCISETYRYQRYSSISSASSDNNDTSPRTFQTDCNFVEECWDCD